MISVCTVCAPDCMEAQRETLNECQVRELGAFGRLGQAIWMKECILCAVFSRQAFLLCLLGIPDDIV